MIKIVYMLFYYHHKKCEKNYKKAELNITFAFDIKSISGLFHN